MGKYATRRRSSLSSMKPFMIRDLCGAALSGSITTAPCRASKILKNRSADPVSNQRACLNAWSPFMDTAPKIIPRVWFPLHHS